MPLKENHLRSLSLSAIVLFVAGCSTNFSTLQPENSSKQVIYAVPEEQAFQIAFSALGQVLPGNEITDIDGPVKGYSATFRFLLDTYSQQVIVIPASAKDADGRTVRGYYYEVSGSGSSVVQGRAKNVQLFETISTSARSTGKAVFVSSVTREPYSGARWKQGDAGRQSPAPPARPEGGADAITQIERLQQLRDRGAITEEEFQRKKKELLDRV